ncbi:TPA: hypothetical protein ACFP4Q_001209 [Neisseria weaveri]|uniref:hypothetical protein n=1 Tax=Neisseria weaveri TaxID=28091 RepID=UPI000D2F6EC1|nr:hypothetical protein [Neisseria weaveri]
MSNPIQPMPCNHLPSSFETFSIQCESGWLPLIRPLIDYIDSYNQHKPESEHIIILQIKQKFGGLSFHTNFTDETLERMIEQAQQKSLHVCEKCGSTEQVDGIFIKIQGKAVLPRVKTLCVRCAEADGQTQSVSKTD